MKKVKPIVSVIMGAYNCEATIIESINSIQTQLYKKWELIICDDGSKDNTYTLAKSLTKQDKRIKLIRNKENMGLSPSLNKCIKNSTGKYIARMDSDDISISCRFKIQVEFLDNNPEYGLVGSNAILFNNKNEWGFRKLAQKPEKKGFLYGSQFVHPTIMIRKDALVRLKGYRNSKETLRTQDYDLFMRFYSMGMKGYNIQEPLLKYREDYASCNRRRYKFRFNEAIIRYKGFKALGLMPIGLIFVFKPLLIGLIPQKILASFRNEKIKTNYS